jgi:hypothetical protein
MTTVAKLMGSGVPAAQAQATTAGVPSSGLTAAGSTQGTATLITSDFSVFSTVPASSGARLPVANASSMCGLAGDIYVVVNASATAMLVYPPTGGSFVNAAASASLAGGKTGDFYCLGGNVWAPSVGG